MNIDVHWHHVPRRLVDAILSGSCPIEGGIDLEGPDPAITAGAFRLPLTERLTEVEPALAAMDAAGIDIATPSIAPALRQYEAEPANGARICRLMNDAAAELVDVSRGRFRPLANVPLQDPALAAEELRRSILELGLTGVAIGTNIGGRYISEPEFAPFWKEVAELDAFVFIHPQDRQGVGAERLGRHELDNFVGFPIDTALTIALIIFDGVFDQYGLMKICLAHGGGAFPYLVSRWQHGYGARLAGKSSARDPYSYLGSIYCDSLTHGSKQLRFLAEVVGADHIMLGSDFPFNMGDPQPVASMEAAIPDPDRRLSIGGATAAQLLGLGAGSERPPG